MNKNDVVEILDKLSDKDFIEIIRKSKNRIQKIEKKEKFEAVERKFKEKGIQCPDCYSFLCIKNGSKDFKQRYKCKNCNITFHAFKKHYFYWSHLSHDQWDLLIQIATLGQSAHTISQFINTTTKTAWFNRLKFMKSPQLAKLQQQFKKLKGRIEMDETFIKEIHKGNFKNPNDRRKQWIEPDSKSTKCCIQMAIDENKNIYAQVTNTKRLKRKWVQENLISELIEENSIIACDMQTLYDIVAQQTKSTLQQFKSTVNKELNYQNLNNVSKIQSSLKEFITHYHGIGFTNVQNYLNLWKFKYQHYGLTPYQKSAVLYFAI